MLLKCEEMLPKVRTDPQKKSCLHIDPVFVRPFVRFLLWEFFTQGYNTGSVSINPHEMQRWL